MKAADLQRLWYRPRKPRPVILCPDCGHKFNHKGAQDYEDAMASLRLALTFPVHHNGSHQAPVMMMYCHIRQIIAASHLVTNDFSRLMSDFCPGVRAAVVGNPVLAASTVSEYLNDEDFEVRRAIWARADRTPEMTAALEDEFA